MALVTLGRVTSMARLTSLTWTWPSCCRRRMVSMMRTSRATTPFGSAGSSVVMCLALWQDRKKALTASRFMGSSQVVLGNALVLSSVDSYAK